MNKPVIPFTLEQEANYRKQIQDLLAEEHNVEYKKQAGVLTNMTLYEIVKAINDAEHNFVEEHQDYIEAVAADFSFLSCHVYDWFEDEDVKPYRLLIEEREKKLTGKVSDLNEFEKNFELPVLPKKSKVLHRNGLDPDRELTEKEMFEFFEEEMQNYADRYDIEVNDFKQMIRAEMTKNTKKKRRKKPKGFGNSK